MGIYDLYHNFEVKRACELLSRSGGSRTEMVSQLVAFNMFLASILWPADKAQRKVQHAARVTARSMMIQLQVRAEQGYLAARQGGDPELRHHGAYNVGHYIGVLARDAVEAEYSMFLDQVVLPLGGSRFISRTVSDASFRRQIDQRWKSVQFAALMADILIRHAAAKIPRKPSTNRAADFIVEEGYGPSKVKKRAELMTLWGKYKAKAPLLYALWKTSPDVFLLHASACARNDEKYLRDTIQRAHENLDEANWAKTRLLEIENIVNADPQFIDFVVARPSSPQPTQLFASPLSEADRAILLGYRVKKGANVNVDQKSWVQLLVRP